MCDQHVERHIVIDVATMLVYLSIRPSITPLTQVNCAQTVHPTPTVTIEH